MSDYERQVALRQRKMATGKHVIHPTVDDETYALLVDLVPQFGSYGAMIEYMVGEHLISRDGVCPENLPPRVNVHGQFMLSRHALTILMTVRKDTGKNFDEIIEKALGLLMDHGLPDD